MILHDWQLTPERVAIHRPTATAVVADLHLGYQEARRQSGDAVPLVDLNTQLLPLLRVLRTCQVRSLVIAGDMFEKAFDGNICQDFIREVNKTGVHFRGLVPGNHDRGLENAAELPLLREGCVVGDWRILHGDGPLPDAPVVLGHFHPSVSHAGRKIPCYVAGERFLILPAYSREAAGGLPRRQWQDCRYLGIALGKVFEVKTRKR